MEELRSGARVPTPPGMKSTSSGGAVSNVCVGTMDSPKVELKEFMAAERALVDTGSSVAAIIERLSCVFQERRFNASSGPKTSRAWNDGKTIKPMVLGARRWLWIE